LTQLPSDGQAREVFCISQDCLPMWLATIYASKVKPAVRPLLVAFQKECAQVLRDHFLGKPQAPAAPPFDPVQFGHAIATACAAAIIGALQPILERLVAPVAAQAAPVPPIYPRVHAAAHTVEVLSADVTRVPVGLLRTARESIDVTVPQLARAARMAPEVLLAAEDGVGGVTPTHLQALAQLLFQSPIDLLAGRLRQLTPENAERARMGVMRRQSHGRPKDFTDEHSRYVGARIRELRLARGWSQRALSIKVDVSGCTVCWHEHGRKMSYRAVERYAKAFNLPVEALTGEMAAPVG
jgi:transcriptional regulator with XRE-family HTH domain